MMGGILAARDSQRRSWGISGGNLLPWEDDSSGGVNGALRKAEVVVYDALSKWMPRNMRELLQTAWKTEDESLVLTGEMVENVEGAAEGETAANGRLVGQSPKRRNRWREVEEEGGAARKLQNKQDAGRMLLGETAAGKIWVGKMQDGNTFLSQTGDMLRYRDKTVPGAETVMDVLRKVQLAFVRLMELHEGKVKTGEFEKQAFMPEVGFVNKYQPVSAERIPTKVDSCDKLRDHRFKGSGFEEDLPNLEHMTPVKFCDLGGAMQPLLTALKITVSELMDRVREGAGGGEGGGDRMDKEGGTN
jgi:hypothetical protein